MLIWYNILFTQVLESVSEMETLNEDVTEYEKLKSVVWPEDEYIVEYSLEYGFLK